MFFSIPIEKRIRWSVWIGWLGWMILAGLSIWFATAPESALPPDEQTVRSFQWIPFFAPFHSVILHFPIGFIVILGILELHMFRTADPGWRPVIHLLVSLTAWSAVTVACFGLLRGSGGGYDREILQAHLVAGVTVATLAVTALTLHARVALQRSDGWRLKAYRTVLAVLSVVVVYAGHQGGSLTHGSRYLTRNAPDFVREYWAGSSAADVLSSVSLDEGRRHYIRIILPILDQKCKKCHGENAQMSGYRLDVEDIVFAGGQSGFPAIVPGDPAASNLIRVILLPDSHSKKMPPTGLSPLTDDELLLIMRWVRDGAPYVPDELAVVPLVDVGE